MTDEPPERRELREALADPDRVIHLGPDGEYLGSRHVGLAELDRIGREQAAHVQEVPENDYLSKGYGGPLQVTKLTAFMAVPAELVEQAEADRQAFAEWEAMTPEQRAGIQRRRDQERASALAAARDEWQQLRDRLTGNAPALTVLDLHKPSDATYWLACAHCQEGADGDPTEWPCATYTAIKEAADA